MSADQPRVLVVEDEPAQLEVLAYNLEAEGFAVSRARDGEEALLVITEDAPDIVVLDWMMPNLSGIEVCRRIKSKPETRAIPVIMLSARVEEVDKVRGLETGADDYVVKPYSVIELMARVRSQLRRVRPAMLGHKLEYEDITLNAETHKVTRGPDELKPGRVWSRDQLLDRVWGRDLYVDTRTVDVHIGRLRKALSQHGGTDPLRTVRGVGYALG